jgi:phosphate transport system substrate-binding protein
VDPSQFAGEAIVAAGSSTVFPLTEAIAERWGNEGGQAPTIDSVGTGGGFERFCVNSASDIANASRPIDEEEAAACEQNGRPAIEFRVGTDALVVAVSSENDFLEELTTEQLAQVFSTATNWSDIDPSFPNAPIERLAPGTDSGTFDYFVEEIFEEDPEPLLRAANLQQSEDDNVLVQGVEGSPNAIGFFGFAYFQENEDRLKAIRIDGVEPNAGTAESNEYPLSRPLFIYSAESVMQEKPAVAAFINFYLTNVNEEIEEVGYFPASEEALNEARQNFLTATGQ